MIRQFYMLMVSSIGLFSLRHGKDELISMRVYLTRNLLTSESFFNGILKCCEGKPEFIVDNTPWLKDALTMLRLAYHHQTPD